MGILVLMGSGELTATMVEIHKMLLARFGAKSCAVFLDTPAGFQLNADQISANAVEYFRKRVGSDMAVASYKSHKSTTEIDAALAFQRLRRADYIMMGPGSPTYTVNQLLPSQIPNIFIDHVHRGGCLVAASAAALTMGRFTLPVYEIYKVGAGLHWVEGLDTLGSLGLALVVIPPTTRADVLWANSDMRNCLPNCPTHCPSWALMNIQPASLTLPPTRLIYMGSVLPHLFTTMIHGFSPPAQPIL